MVNIKNILQDENCLGIIIKDTNGKGYNYQPTNDIGFWFEYVRDDDIEVYYTKIRKLKQKDNKFVVAVKDELPEIWCYYKTLKELKESEGLI